MPGASPAPSSSSPLEHWTEARPHMVRTLRLLNTLTGALPTSGHIGAGTRRALTGGVVREGPPVVHGVDVLGPIDRLLTEAGASGLMPWTGDALFSDLDHAAPTLMGQVASAALTEAARRLVEAATARADEQTRALETFLVGLTPERRTDYFRRWEERIGALLNEVYARATEALSGAITTGGSMLRQWLVEWYQACRSAWQVFRGALMVSAAGFGLAPLIVVGLILLAASKRRRRRN